MPVMSHRRERGKTAEPVFTRIVDSLTNLSQSKTIRNIIIILVVVAIIVVASGLPYNLTVESIGVAFIGGSIRVFIPSLRAQTYAELLVTSTFYIFGFIGMLLYILASQQVGSPRSNRYMMIFSVLLLLFAFLGLIGGFVSKLG